MSDYKERVIKAAESQRNAAGVDIRELQRAFDDPQNAQIITTEDRAKLKRLVDTFNTRDTSLIKDAAAVVDMRVGATPELAGLGLGITLVSALAVVAFFIALRWNTLEFKKDLASRGVLIVEGEESAISINEGLKVIASGRPWYKQPIVWGAIAAAAVGGGVVTRRLRQL